MESRFENQTQTDWKWCIAIHLFLAGLGPGAYIVGVLAGFLDPAWEPITRIGVTLGFLLVAIDAIILVLDLGVKSRALRVFLNPGTSWIARGSLLISGFMILCFLHLVLIWVGQLPANAPELRLLGIATMVFSVLVIVYTGVLLGASRAIAFWNTALLPLLFLLSAGSTGVQAILLLTSAEDSLFPAFNLLARTDTFLIVIELLVIAFYLQASHRTDESRTSVQLLLKGRLAKMFWLGLVAVGLAAPLLLELLAVGSGELWLLRIAAICGLVGGLVLRRLILAAGVKIPLRAGGIDFTFPTPVIK